MTPQSSLTPTDILVAASRLLEAGGYRRVERPLGEPEPIRGARLFEDAYSVVAVIVYETWSALSGGWPEAQGALVEAMSSAIASAEPKAWEGYLVLLTSGEIGRDARAEVGKIRYNTARVRKLVAGGDELRYLGDVERALLPVLPLSVGADLTEAVPTLDLLPRLLGARGLPENAVRVMVAAFYEQQPLIEQLHAHLADSSAAS